MKAGLALFPLDPSNHPPIIIIKVYNSAITILTRLLSISSQPKKVVAVNVLGLAVVVVVVHIFDVFIVVVDPRNLPLKVGQNWVIHSQDLVVVVVDIVVLLLLL